MSAIAVIQDTLLGQRHICSVSDCGTGLFILDSPLPDDVMKGPAYLAELGFPADDAPVYIDGKWANHHFGDVRAFSSNPHKQNSTLVVELCNNADKVIGWVKAETHQFKPRQGDLIQYGEA